MKYSIFAEKVIRRGTISGRKMESEKDRWLLARMAGPVAGTWCSPSTQGRKTRRTGGPTTTCLSTW